MDKNRLTLELPGMVRKNLDILKKKTGASSVTEVLRKAINLYAIALKYGGVIRVIGKKGEPDTVISITM